MKTAIKTILAILAVAFLQACSGTNAAGTRVGNPPTTGTTEAFPQGLAITSPLETATQATNSLSLVHYLATTPSPLYATSYSIATDLIDTILNGDEISDCLFDPDAFVESSTNAACYGPSINYRNHPEASPGDPSASGQLPTGDVGIWNENGTGEACAAAELNARMRGVQQKAQAALQSLASMICVANVNGVDLPESGETVDLLTEMNAMATSNSLDVAFTTADLMLDAVDGFDAYSYDLVFTALIAGQDTELTLAMTHVLLDANNSTYMGRFTYRFNNPSAGGSNCATTTTSTDAGSVLYNLAAEDALNIRFDSANYCGSDADAIAADGVLDPDDSFNPNNPTDNPDGWANNYNVLIADFDPSTSAGSYSYSWQAGSLDDKSRIFNIALSRDEENEILSGSSFFGFGNSVNSTGFDGNMDGFICNWAGPGNSHDPVPFVQRQDILEDPVSGVFGSIADTLAITYAPTTTCDYDGSKSFEYDSDADTVIDTDPATPVANGLFLLDADSDGTVDDANGNGVADALEDLGYVAPVEPENF